MSEHEPLQLVGNVDESVSRVEDLESRVEGLHAEIQHLRQNIIKSERKTLVTLLGILQTAMRDVASGKFDLASVEVEESSSKWDAIKQRLQPRHQQAIDILLLQQPMSRKQLAAALKMNYTNCVNNVVSTLLRQGLVVDGASGLVLKELG